MKDLGLMHYYLGLEVCQKPAEVFLGQGKYLVNILQNFGMMDCRSMENHMVKNMKKLRDSDSDMVDPYTYQKLIGSLMYLVNNRPYIFFDVNTLIQFQLEPRHEHWMVTKNILIYLQGTLNYFLRYVSNSDLQIQGYTYYNWVGNVDDRNNTSGVFFSFSSAMISWTRRK
jgi:hypothetical protein